MTVQRLEAGRSLRGAHRLVPKQRRSRNSGVRAAGFASALCLMTVLVGAVPRAMAEPNSGCGPDQATAVQSALAQVPPPQIAAANARVRWSANIWPPDSNYNPCADLSTVLITVEGATGSSPMQALMFHRGTYLGTGTVKDYPYMSLNKAASTNDTVVVNYQVGKTCSVMQRRRHDTGPVPLGRHESADA
jgi:LppP/LprE lipoprotein